MSIILRQSTQIKVRIGVAVAVGDGFTPVTTLTLSGADEAELLKANGAATVDISGATFAAISGADGWYDLTLTTSHTDTVGEVLVVVNDDSLILPIYQRFQVIEEAAYDALFAASAPGYVANAPVNVAQFGGSNGTFSGGRPEVNTSHLAGSAVDQSGGLINANVKQISGDATAADNFETMLDGTGGKTLSLATLAISGDLEAGNVVVAGDVIANDLTLSGNFNAAAVLVSGNFTVNGLNGLSWNTSWDAEVQSEVEDALVAHRLDELLNADSDIDGAQPPTVGSVFHELMTKTAGSFTYDQTTDSLEAVRDNVGTAGAGLTAIDLPDQTMNITGNITGNLSGSVGSVAGAVGSVTGNVGGNVTGSVGSISGVTFPSNFAALGINASGHVSRVTLTDTLTTYTGDTPQTGDSYAIVNSGTHGNAAIKGYVDDIGVAGAGLTALGDARLANLDALISSRMATYTQPTGFLAATFPSDPADQSLVIAATDALAALIGDVPTNAELATALDDIPTAEENAAGLLDLAAGVETGLTPRQALRLIAAALAGKLSVAATTTVVIRNAVADSKDRITATVDADGNRSAITVDLS